MGRSKITQREQLQIIQTDGRHVQKLFNADHEYIGNVYQHCGIYYAIYNNGFYVVLGKHYYPEEVKPKPKPDREPIGKVLGVEKTDGGVKIKIQKYDNWPEEWNEETE